MIKVLIGHRGVGKTQLLKRLQEYFPNDLFFDLDQEIEKSVNKPISEIFKTIQEQGFRKIENEILQNLIKNQGKVWISIGAGFKLREIPSDIEKIWIRRDTDSLGRIFIDRPKLKSEMSFLQESKALFHEREDSYSQECDWQYLMPEGIFSFNQFEKQIFAQKSDLKGAVVTLTKKNINSAINFNFDFYEIRDDLLPASEIKDLLGKIPSNKIIFSYRNNSKNYHDLKPEIIWDWPLEFSKNSQASILSLHQRDDNFEQTLIKLEQNSHAHQHLKLAVVVNNFTELSAGFRWQSEDPKNRSFLPRSSQGRWAWARLLLKQKLNFVRMDQGLVSDQPTLYEWLSTPAGFKNFAAVLGNPVTHSQSPLYHQKYFHDRKIPFFKISVEEDEFDEAISFLAKNNLMAAAVTSPLKKKAFAWSKDKSFLANEFKSANTLWKSRNGWVCDNTDYEGLEKLCHLIQGKNVAIWGGGGTLPAIHKLLPQAEFYSVRTGTHRHGKHENYKPEVVIWAGAPSAEMPTLDWHPNLVIDLNYREDSLAKEYSMKTKAEYISGFKMFETQARAQQRIWSEL